MRKLQRKKIEINAIKFKANGMSWRMILYKQNPKVDKSEKRPLVLFVQIGAVEDANQTNLETFTMAANIGFNISIEVDDKNSFINRHKTVSSEWWTTACGAFSFPMLKCSLLKEKSFRVKIAPTTEQIPRGLHVTPDYIAHYDTDNYQPDNAFSVQSSVYRYVNSSIDPEFQYLRSTSFDVIDTDDSEQSICSVLGLEYLLHEQILSSNTINSTSIRTKQKEKSVSRQSVALRTSKRPKRMCLQNGIEFDNPNPEINEELEPEQAEISSFIQEAADTEQTIHTTVKRAIVETGDVIEILDEESEEENVEIDINANQMHIDASLEVGVPGFKKTDKIKKSRLEPDHDSNISQVNNVSPSMSPRPLSSTPPIDNHSRVNVPNEHQLLTANKELERKTEFWAKKSRERMVKADEAELQKSIAEEKNKEYEQKIAEMEKALLEKDKIIGELKTQVSGKREAQ